MEGVYMNCHDMCGGSSDMGSIATHSDDMHDVIAGLSPVTTPVESPVDIPIEPPVDIPIEPPVDIPIEPPVDIPIEPSVDIPIEPPVNKRPRRAAAVLATQTIRDVLRWEKCTESSSLFKSIDSEINAEFDRVTCARPYLGKNGDGKIPCTSTTGQGGCAANETGPGCGVSQHTTYSDDEGDAHEDDVGTDSNDSDDDVGSLASFVVDDDYISDADESVNGDGEKMTYESQSDSDGSSDSGSGGSSFSDSDDGADVVLMDDSDAEISDNDVVEAVVGGEDVCDAVVGGEDACDAVAGAVEVEEVGEGDVGVSVVADASGCIIID
jgi:hypothetical protein